MALSKNSKILVSDITGAIKSITRSGTTFTYTTLGGSTGTFTQQDNNTTYSNFTKATSSAAGKAGLVPAPAAGNQASFLRGDCTWATPSTVTAIPNVTVQTVSGQSFTLPSGGTWAYYMINNRAGTAYVNSANSQTGTASGGTTITQTGRRQNVLFSNPYILTY